MRRSRWTQIQGNSEKEVEAVLQELGEKDGGSQEELGGRDTAGPARSQGGGRAPLLVALGVLADSGAWACAGGRASARDLASAGPKASTQF